MIGRLFGLVGLFLLPFKIILGSALRVVGFFLGLLVVAIVVWILLTQC